MAREDVVLAAVGDLLPFRKAPHSMFEHVREPLQSASLTFGQLEAPYSDRGSMRSNGPRGAVPNPVGMLPAITDAGFDVISMASNHALDYGTDGLLDCMQRLTDAGVAVVGAGANLSEARRPVVLERGGTKIAFLAYCSVAPAGYYAASNMPGVGPMRAMTHYEPRENDQPGTPCRILTFPDDKDLRALVEDVSAAAEQADIVAVSFHWGLHHSRALIADYQPVVAHAAIDAGAGLILGHHPHILKGIEVYNGVVIFYSLGNFAFDSKSVFHSDTWNQDYIREHVGVYSPGGVEEYVSNPYGARRKTMIAKCYLHNGTTRKVTFVPVVISDTDEPEIFSASSPEGQDVLSYVQEITREANLETTFTIEGDEVRID